MAIIDDIKNKHGETVYPRTIMNAVYQSGTNKTLDKVLQEDLRAERIRLNNVHLASTNIDAGMSELFTNVSNGKSLVGRAITDLDDRVAIPAEPSFMDLAGAIGNINTGKRWAVGTTRTTTTNGLITVSGLDFKPSILIVSSVYVGAFYVPGVVTSQYDYFDNNRRDRFEPTFTNDGFTTWVSVGNRVDESVTYFVAE